MKHILNLKKRIAHMVMALVPHVFKWAENVLKSNNNDPYHDLTPLDNLPRDEYMNALEWALDNDKVKNIAITGSYGSGKSSILRSFEKQNRQHKYLRISLASFTADQKTPIEDFKTGQLIEQSILQQIFYREEAKRFSHSRFKRIIRPKIREVLKRSIPMSFWLLVGFGLFYRQYFNSISPVQIPIEAKTWLFSLFLLGSLYLIYRVFDFMRGISLDKINVLKGDIELSKKVDSSIFNKYLDEIIYFFSNEKYNVVYIEDLDRYENPAIFVKLRELNLLLNEAKEIKAKPVVFIYAVKDDLFDSTDSRTKFFDFIIPIIPVINPSNSKDILLEKLKEYHINKPLVRFVSTYVEDMRILHNIINEFTIYYRKLSDFNIIPSKLFSIIVYKNLYPKDFSELHFNKGIVFSFFESKEEIKRGLMASIKAKIADKTKKLNEIDMELLESTNELNLIYIGAFATLLSNQHTPNIQVDGKKVQLNDLLNIDFMESLLSNNNVRYVTNQNSWSNLSIDDLEKITMSDKDYEQRKELILEKMDSSKQDLEIMIENLKFKKIEISELNLAELLSENHSIGFLREDLKSYNFIFHLLAEGYIDENYHNYISYFYPGSLTRKDEEFRRSVYEGKPKTLDFELTNIKEIIDSFTTRHFQSEAILNFNLVNYLLDNSSENDKLKLIVEYLSTRDEESVQFIHRYFREASNPQYRFIEFLCSYWPEFWKFIVDEKLSIEMDNHYIKLIITGCSNDTLGLLNSHSPDLLSFSIENMPNFLEVFAGDENLSKIKISIEYLGVRFTQLNRAENDNALLEFICKNSLFRLNAHMIELMIERFSSGSYNPERIYGSVKDSKIESLKNYVEEQVELFVIDCLILKEEIKEDEDHFIELLKTDIDPTHKGRLIKIQKGTISHINEVPTNLWSTLLLEFKVAPNWDNIGLYYAQDDGGLVDELIDYLNDKKVVDQLSNHNFMSNIVNTQIMQTLERDIILCERIDNYSYSQILSKTITKYNELPIEKLSEEKAILLVQNQILSFSEINYEILRKSFFPLNTVLVEQNQELFLSLIKKLTVDEKDLLEILYRDGVDFNTEASMLKLIDITQISISSELADEIIPILKDASIRFEKSVEISIFKNATWMPNKLRYLKLIIGDFTKPEITKLFINLPEEYEKMSKKGKQTFLPNLQEALDLVLELMKIGYISSYDFKEDKIKVNSKKKGNWLN